ncbi:MAG: glycosyltransferase family 2 protein [Paenibacillaceae bacterium]|jgi:glycosyltransferase involved in cell wall biosynthesis|nr:glycosyltransferase family 2 protein [Paenibacillaceae bacterium]
MKILTIAVPSYNMEKHLAKNLLTYCDERLADSLEVIILNNASIDLTVEVSMEFVKKHPTIFVLKNRLSRGYGSSINEAMRDARGSFFRIVDADDWVDTEQLILLIEKLKDCSADVVQTHYQTVHMQTGEIRPSLFRNIEYDHVYYDLVTCRDNVPCIHSIIYRTGLLRENNITLQDNIFFVDEEYVILPFLYTSSVIFYSFNIYRYLIGNPTQSTSPNNRAKYYKHREKIIKRLINFFKIHEMNQGAKQYCFFRISQAAGDHLTTLCMFFNNRKQGRTLAKEWLNYVQGENQQFYNAIRKKAFLLFILNYFHVSLSIYEKLKKNLLQN